MVKVDTVERVVNGLSVRAFPHLDGMNWLYTNKKNGHTLSVACNSATYGYKSGLFEVYPSWRNASENEAVAGWLTFGEVQKWINELANLETDTYNKEMRDYMMDLASDENDAIENMEREDDEEPNVSRMQCSNGFRANRGD